MFGTSLRSPLPSLKLPAGELLECIEQFVAFASIGCVSAWNKDPVFGVIGILTSLAAVRLLKIPRFEAVTCYVAFAQDKTAAVDTANPTLLKTLVGGAKLLGGGIAWTKGKINFPFDVEADIVKSQRDASGNSDFGIVH
jgi:hypothetical protein